MKHLFASGEHIYSKNVKPLKQGVFIAEYLNYDDVKEDTVFEAVGSLGRKPAAVRFKISKESFEEIKFKHMVKILMQSDLMLADWEYYEINYLDVKNFKV